jgi:hypothetical protein
MELGMPRLEREGLSVDNMIPSRHSAKAQENARRHDEGYALITAQNAASAAERGRTWGRG